MNVKIIIPAKNQFDDVDRIFKSLTEQHSKRPISVLVIDRGSTDGMKERIENTWDQRMAFLVLKDEGDQNVAYKNMFEQARSDVVIVLHPKNHIDANYLNTMVSPFENDQQVVGVSGPDLGALPKQGFWEKLLYGNPAFNEANFAVLKSAYDRVGGLQPQDGALAIAMLFGRLRQVGALKRL